MSSIFDASECDDWLHSKQAELRALMAEAGSVRREAAVMREANAQSRFRLQQAWASISAQWGLTPPADAEPEAVDDEKPRRAWNNGERKLQVWIPLTFPPVPKKGGWDVSRLRESEYFFS
ncbi:MAG: hypothetical protein EOO38_26550 [Cytophagaceae bacterium]|nr:MAG: hypothetical protein EOO38_26550 [Cytophagaceae bacterium]